MKKVIALLLAATMLMGILCGCNNTAVQEQSGEQQGHPSFHRASSSEFENHFQLFKITQLRLNCKPVPAKQKRSGIPLLSCFKIC